MTGKWGGVMWCPKCGGEYREGYFFCADCACPLVEELEKEPELERDPDSNDEWCFLTTVSSDIEAGSLEALMEENDIPVLKKYPGASGYLKVFMGMVTTGVKLYVPESNIQTATTLLSECLSAGKHINDYSMLPDEINESFNNVPEGEGRRAFRDKKKSMKKLLGIIILINIVLPLLFEIFSSLRKALRY